MMRETPEAVRLIPIGRIEVLNSRDRNTKVFEEIVGNIKAIGLKKPITVTQRVGLDGEPRFILVCGEGRLNAFRLLGETHIPALVVEVDDEDAFIMSLAENIARCQYRPLEILADIESLRQRSYGPEAIAHKTGLSAQYVNNIIFLLERGEERLIEGVQKGQIPLTTALEIARAGDNNKELGAVLQQAYESGQLRGRQLIEARRLVEKREALGPGVSHGLVPKSAPVISPSSLVRTYQKEVERKKKMVIKAEYSQNKLLFVIEALRTLFADENLVNLLRAEGLESLPAALADRINLQGVV
ncbi:MAG: ParB/RepB/Spo0J family partition protein [Georgfuchsia sp.]